MHSFDYICVYKRSFPWFWNELIPIYLKNLCKQSPSLWRGEKGKRGRLGYSQVKSNGGVRGGIIESPSRFICVCETGENLAWIGEKKKIAYAKSRET